MKNVLKNICIFMSSIYPVYRLLMSCTSMRAYGYTFIIFYVYINVRLHTKAHGATYLCQSYIYAFMQTVYIYIYIYLDICVYEYIIRVCTGA